MSDEQEELLTGRASNEAAQDWSPMVAADPVPSGDELADLEPITEADLAHLKRPAPPEPVERAYYNNETGEEVPEKQSVTAEQAAHDLKTTREAELKQIENEAREALSAALDGQPQQDQQPDQPQLDGIQPEMTAEEAQALYAQADKELEAALQNPLLREKISAEYSQVQAQAAAQVQQAAQQAEQAKQAFAQHTAALAAESSALLFAQFPELASQNADELRGKLQMLNQTNPNRAASFVQLAARAGQIAQVQQQAQADQWRATYERQQHEFQRYAAEQDTKAFANTPPEELRAIREFLYADAEKAGISRAQVNQHWSNNVALRHSYISELLADGAKYRMARQGMKSARHNPVQPVQRPGVASERPKVYDDDLAAAASRFNLPGGAEGQQGIRNAAAWLSARRARG